MGSLTAPAGYARQKCLHESTRGAVYAAEREEDGREVVLKAYHAGRGRPLDEMRLGRELEALRAAAGPGVPAIIDVLVGHHPPLLVLERVAGMSLAIWCKTRSSFDPDAFLEVAVQLVSALARVHARHLIHRDINPENILVDRTTLRAHLIDFGLARPLGAASSAHDAAKPSGESAGTLRYMAPEQTGRMNRGCDFRSDLYSLGCVFYLMLTGRPPFDASDPLELVHAHIARLPAPPIELRGELPRVLSDLVFKLLCKEPEARYQSAKALLVDLEICRAELGRSGHLDAQLALGSADAPGRPRFSRKLRGREREAARLEAAFEACALGSTRIVLLEGEAGVGKSSLVDGLRPVVAESGGYLASGKFDLYRDRPYAGWAAVLESLAQQVLVESDERLERWRAELCGGLGNIGQALVDLAPDLSFVVGPMPAVPALGPAETRSRLSLALQRFVAVAATREHPLVLFLDDLQWSDAGSLALLEDLLGSSREWALLLIGACRRHDVDSTDPLRCVLSRIEEQGAAIEVLPIGPLAAGAVARMLAEVLERPLEAVVGLAAILERKTGNSPLLVRQFIEHIHARGLLQYAANTGWTWDAADIAAADIPDGAVALMTAKLEHLDREPREVLQLASCVGDEFDVELLSGLGRRARVQLEASLYALCDAGLIAACASGFRFVHGAIRDAARASLSDGERSQLHAETAQYLLAHLSEPEQHARVFEIVDHLNRGARHLPGALQMRVTELNLIAGKRALASGADATAAAYLDAARDLFGEEEWATRHALGVELYLESAENAFQKGEYAQAIELLDALETRPLTRLELARAASKRMRMLPLLKTPEECVRILLGILRRFGVHWPLHPSRLRASIALRMAGAALALRGASRFLRPAAAPDVERLLPILILAPAGSSVLLHDLNLAAMTTSLALRSYLRWGHLSSPSYRLATFSTYSYMLLGGPELARRRVQLVREWNDLVPNPVYGPRAEHVIQVMLLPWLTRRREALAPMGRIAEAVREIGDPEFYQYARFLTLLYVGLAGDPVSDVERRMREHAESVSSERPWHAASVQQHRIYRRLLSDASHEPLEADIERSRAVLTGYLPYLITLSMLVFCVLRRDELALAQSEWLGARLFRVVPFVHVADHTFYRGLASARLASRARGATRRRHLRALRESWRRLRRWARGGPDFEHMALLLEAERARLRGRASAALALYERASQRAMEQEFVHHAALAHEQRALLLVHERRDTAASTAHALAVRLYKAWGATAKVAALDRDVATD
jgi:histidine kinase